MHFENQKMLESFFNERQTNKLLRKQFMDCPELIEKIQQASIDEDFALDLLGHMVLAKRSTVPALVGLLKHHFHGSFDPHQKAADQLLVAIEIDLVDYHPEKRQVILRFDVDPSTHALIKQYQYLPPMTVPPLKVTDNRGSGYLSIRTDSLILKKNHHDEDIGLDSINRFNQVPMSINFAVATQAKNQWKHLDKAKPGETYEEYQDRVKAFNRFQKDAAFTMALMEQMGNRFWFTHKVDKRGRTYCQGYHLNYQGHDWSKAVLELADKEPITE